MTNEETTWTRDLVLYTTRHVEQSEGIPESVSRLHSSPFEGKINNVRLRNQDYDGEKEVTWFDLRVEKRGVLRCVLPGFKLPLETNKAEIARAYPVASILEKDLPEGPIRLGALQILTRDEVDGVIFGENVRLTVETRYHYLGTKIQHL